MTGPARIRPPYMLHTLHATPGLTGSPAVGAVYLTTEDLDGRWLAGDVLMPAQARELAAQLVAAADAADGAR